MRRFIPAVVILCVLAVIGYQNVSAKGDMTKEDVQTIVKEYLVENPIVVVDALEAYQEQMQEKASQEAKKAIMDNQAALFESSTMPAIGPEDADIVIAEFFDYHCGYCKRMLPVIGKLLEEDKNVRVVFHELPILSKDSRRAAKAALAVYQLKPDAYFDYHTVLMNTPGKYTEKLLVEEAVKLGLDKEVFTKTLNSKEMDNALQSSADIAKAIGVSGTPALVINDELIPGAVSYPQLQEIIAEQRAAK